MTGRGSGFLHGLRVVDLTNQRGLMAAHLLARMGADVIQVEPPGGSDARRTGPFSDAPPPDNSLVWAAYAAGKRSMICDLATEASRTRLLELIRSTDVLFESSGPGVLDALGLGWEALRAANPRLIYVAISPFGATGPKAGYADSDLIMWAAGGALINCRDANGTPLRISVPQAYANASADAAVGALVAHHARLASGLGQRVDISVQSSVAQCTLSSVLADAVGDSWFDLNDPGKSKPQGKSLDLSGSGARTRRSKWPVLDGLVEFHLGLGRVAGGSANAMFSWMREAGALDPRYDDWDWIDLPGRIQAGEVSEAEVNEARSAAGRFLAGFTKAVIVEQAMRRGMLLAPIMTTGDLLASPQFAARSFPVRQPDAPAGPLTLPGNFAYGCDEGFATLSLAPRLGENSADMLWPDRNISETGGGPMTAPFAGLKVLDLAWVVAGPTIGRVLADYGADVVRVESTKRVDTARMLGPYAGGVTDRERSAGYDNCNAGKWGLALDLSRPEARDIVLDLVRWADVIIESFAAGQMAKWGLGYEVLSAVKPDIVMLSTSLMGGSGPLSGVGGYGNIGAAMAGFQQIVGQPGAVPIGPYGPYTDYVAPRLGLVALLGALDRRRRTGEGALLDVSQVEAALHFLSPALAATSLSGVDASPNGNRDAAMAPHGVFRCLGDGWVAIAIRNDGEWQRLAGLIGGDALASDLAALAGRKAAEDWLEAIVGDWAAHRGAAEVERLLQAELIPAHAAVSSAEFCADEQIQHLRHIVELPHPNGGSQFVEASRFRLSATPAQIARAAPTYGRDTDHVLRTFAGYDDARIASLHEQRVLI